MVMMDLYFTCYQLWAAQLNAGFALPTVEFCQIEARSRAISHFQRECESGEIG